MRRLYIPALHCAAWLWLTVAAVVVAATAVGGFMTFQTMMAGRILESRHARIARARSGSRAWVGTMVRAADVIETGSGGHLTLGVAPGMELTVLEGTRVVIERLTRGQLRARLERGGVRADLRGMARKRYCGVVTPDAVCEAVGTAFSVNLLPEPGTLLDVERGAVKVTGRRDPKVTSVVYAHEQLCMVGDSLYGPPLLNPVVPPLPPELSSETLAGDRIGRDSMSVKKSGDDTVVSDTVSASRDTVGAGETPVNTGKDSSGSKSPVAKQLPPPLPVRADLLSSAGVTARSISGSGRSIRGELPLAILSIPTNTAVEPWSDGELDNLASFIAERSDLEPLLTGRSFAVHGTHRRFSSWLRQAKNRGRSSYRPLSPSYAPDDAIEQLANAAALLSMREYEEARTRVSRLFSSFCHTAFGYDGDLAVGLLGKTISTRRALPGWAVPYLDSAGVSYRGFMQAAKPGGKELKGLYLLFRMSSVTRYPILFCQVKGVPEPVDEDNMGILRDYIRYGGVIYFTHTAQTAECQAVRGLITALTGERLDSKEGGKVLRRFQKTDRFVTGFRFERPVPQVFHPWTKFPLVVLGKADVTISIFDSVGNQVVTDTLKLFSSGGTSNQYYRWEALDRNGGELPSGYYLYQAEAGLCKQTHPMRISSLRRLPKGSHPVYHSFFSITDVPSGDASAGFELPYGEPGIFGVTINGRLAICYSEGYRETSLLSTKTKPHDREIASKWMLNMITWCLGSPSTPSHRSAE